MGKGKSVVVTLGIVVGCAALMLFACGGLLYWGFTGADQAVSPRVDAMFAAIEAGIFADTYETHTTAELRDVASQEEYAALGRAIALRLGGLRSKSLSGFEMQQSNASSYIYVTYAAEFEQGSGTITARLKKEGPDWNFVSFHVNSPVFSQDLAAGQCAECGEPHSASALFCPSCGTQLPTAAETPDDSTNEPATAPLQPPPAGPTPAGNSAPPASEG